MPGRHRGNRKARRYWAERFAVAARAESALERLRAAEATSRYAEEEFTRSRLPGDASSGKGK
jgi:hypothetical protein